MIADTESFLTIRELAARWKLSYHGCWKLIHDGRVPGVVRVGQRALRVRVRDILAVEKRGGCLPLPTAANLPEPYFQRPRPSLTALPSLSGSGPAGGSPVDDDDLDALDQFLSTCQK